MFSIEDKDESIFQIVDIEVPAKSTGQKGERWPAEAIYFSISDITEDQELYILQKWPRVHYYLYKPEKIIHKYEPKKIRLPVCSR